jgi:hypothetical protein
MAVKTYLGNPNLKAAGVVHSYTKEQVEEYMKCAKDVEYFARKYIKIVNVDHGLMPFNMWGFQAKMLKTFQENRFSICKLPRQVGKSTTSIAYILHLVLFTDQQNVAILANKGALARDLLAKLQLAYEYLPKWLQQGVVTWNKGNIELENGSKVLAAATSSSAIRGGSFNLIFLDEFAFVQRNLADAFFASTYPTISSGKTTKIIIVSTPNGMNHFFKMWVDATEGRSEYVPIEILWNDVPGRDDEWKKQTIANTSEEQFRQEFECEFIGSTSTLIHPMKLRELAWIQPSKDKFGLDYYEAPDPRRLYICVFDVSEGVGQDYSAISMFDVTEMPYRQVAKYRSREISPLMFPDVIYRFARWYNNAYVLGETNNIGQQVVNSLYMDLEYENVIATFTKNKNIKVGGGFSVRSAFGIRTTKSVKKIGCSNLKTIVESNKLLISDFETIEELSTFVEDKETYKAEEGCHDDLAMTLVLFGWLITQPYFKDLTNSDIRRNLSQETMKDVHDDLLPAGFFDDGGAAQSMDTGASVGSDDFESGFNDGRIW